MKNSSMEVPDNLTVDDGERASIDRSAVDATRTEGDMPTAYPRLLRTFMGSTVAAALCGLAALAVDGGKGLHPAPFLALGTLSAFAGACVFLSMLMCLLTEAIALWWKER